MDLIRATLLPGVAALPPAGPYQELPLLSGHRLSHHIQGPVRRYVEDTGDEDGVSVVRDGKTIPYRDLVKEVETEEAVN